MSIQKFTHANRTTVNWAKGTSTELFIYPSNGNFAERDFLFRISTATVEADESTFTFFEGITRHLMLLKGKLELIHKGRYTKIMEPYDQDTFSGEWETNSRGQVTDFNLMLKNGTTGSLIHQKIADTNSLSFTPKNDYDFIYIASGLATLSSGDTTAKGDLLQVTDGEITIYTKETCDVIIIEVALPKDTNSMLQ